MFEHARPLRADRPRLPAEARGVPPRAVTWGCGHLGTVPPAEALTCERAPARSPTTPHPSARPRSPAPLSLGAHGAPSRFHQHFLWTRVRSCVSALGLPTALGTLRVTQSAPPHIRARRLVFRRTHASPSGRNSGGGGSPRGWVQILARALATGRPAPAAYTLRASVSIREVGMMTGPASWSLLVSGAAKVPQTKWLKVIETCPLPVLEAGSLTSRCGQGDFP